MSFASYFPIWAQLSAAQQAQIESSLITKHVKKGTIVHGGSTECTGLLLVESGQLRAFSLSADGREITLYRLFERDLCLFSASCMMRSIQFDITVTAEKDTSFWVIPAAVYKRIMEQSAIAANYTNELMASRFSDVMWLMDQILWKRFDARLAGFLLEEAAIEDDTTLHLTHEAIGNHLGNPREVVTRMLKYFQSEGLVRLSRGAIEITNRAGLEAITER